MNSTQLENQSPFNNLKSAEPITTKAPSLTIEDILEDSDNIKLIEQNKNSKAASILTIETIRKLIDYSTKMPMNDSFAIGFQYPLHATQLLCSSNPLIQCLLIHEEEQGGKRRYDVADYLFTFFKQDLNDSYAVVIGYFYKIFDTLLDLLGYKLIEYLFTDFPEAISFLIENMSFKGMADCLERMMTYTDFETSPLAYQKELYQMILVEMNKQNEEQIEIMCETLKYSLLNTPILSLMISSNYSIELLFKVLKKSIGSPFNYRNILSLLIAILDQSKKLFSKQITATSQANDQSDSFEYLLALEQLMIQLNESIQDIIPDFSALSSAKTSTAPKTLGLTKVIQAEFIKSTLELTITAFANFSFEEIGFLFIKKIINQRVLIALTDYYFEYPNHSIFISIFKDILSIVINEVSPPQLISQMFIKANFLSRLMESIIKEKKVYFRFKKYTNNCLFANGVSFLDLISKSSNEAVLSLLKDNKDYAVFNEIFLSIVIKLFNQKLLFNMGSDLFAESSTERNKDLHSFSLEELFEINLMIYSTYREGGNYKKMMAILMEELTVDDDIKKSLCVSEYIDDSNSEMSYLRLEPSDVFSSSESAEDTSYYDNIFWESRFCSQLDDSSLSDLDDLL